MSVRASDTQLRLGSPVTDLPGVGARRAEKLARLGIRTVSDLIRHLPMRYELESAETTIEDLTLDTIGSTRGMVVACRLVGGRGSKVRFEATIEDHSGRLLCTWFNMRHLQGRITAGMTLRVQGKVAAFGGYPQMVNPKWETLGDSDAEPRADEALRPIYPATEDLSSSVIAQLIAYALPKVADQLVDPLPGAMVRLHAMPSLAQAFRMAHLPEHGEEPGGARRRLAYNELLLLQLGIALKRHHTRTRLAAPALRWSGAIDEHIRSRFPFALTPAQDAVVREIAGDLQRTRPMNRLLQGDVGSGKTVVALYALLMAVADRRQGALMAPTELLAEQHALSIRTMLEGSNVRIALITGGRSSQRAAMQAAVEAGDVDLVIGTQALLTESVKFKDLAVVVVDEQHRFGVLQRAAFRQRDAQGDESSSKQRSPHYLVMTATPIPRTLSLTVFGDLDVSTIRGLPPGRTPIQTRVVDEPTADEVYRYMVRRLERGEQAYIVVPTIDAAGGESSARTLKSVREHVKLIRDKYCGDYKVEAIHGQLKRDTREAIMQRFRAGETHVLVATTVIEVGVDVPNATIMIVEHAERFGLAQLHQLRGRVGRGVKRRSLCVLIADPSTDEAAKRLDAIASTTDGFKIAEADLEIRGMGDFFGTRQHGLPPLRVARIPDDMDLLQLARRDAETLVEADATLTEPANARLRRILLQQYGDTLGLIDVG